MIIIFSVFNVAQWALLIFSLVASLLQTLYMVLGFFSSKKFPETQKNHKYGVLIAARNEAKVIAQLIDSIKKQDYPKELIDVFVVADNCTDDTAKIARQAGAVVYERFENGKRGKSYALDFLINNIFEKHPEGGYKGFLFFDADNLLRKNYIHEMNKAVDSGLKIITSYRNSKNFGVNWITSGYAVCFLRECRLVHRARQRLGTSTFVSGTGFYAEAEIFRHEKGWKYNLLTEDIEFSVAQILKDGRVGYAEDAEFYDEQPETFLQSYKQRARWVKGTYQTFWNYGYRLFAGIFSRRGYAKLDLLLFILPTPFVIFMCLGLNVLLHLAYGIFMISTNTAVLSSTLEMTARFFEITYVVTYIMGFCVVFLEWQHIRLGLASKIFHTFLVPLFVITYIPITITAMFSKVNWSQIKRNCTVSIAELEKE